MALNFLTDDDLRVLKQLISDVKSGRVNTRLSSDTERSWDAGEDHQAPETYIALPQTGTGIPALEEVGTGGPGEGDIPGSELCDIYKIVGTSLQLIGASQTVYNITPLDLTRSWLTVTRDKFGKWLAVIGSVAIQPYIITEEAPGSGSPLRRTAITRCTNFFAVRPAEITLFVTKNTSDYPEQIGAFGSPQYEKDTVAWAGYGASGFLVTGDLVWLDTRLSHYFVVAAPFRHAFQGLASADIANGASGTVVIRYLVSGGVAEVEVTCRNVMGADIDDGQVVYGLYVDTENGCEFLIVSAECPAP